MIKAVIFDMDGVLIDSMNIWVEEGLRLLSKFENINAEEVISSVVPIRAKAIFESLIEQGYNEEDCYNFHQTWRSNMKKRYLSDVKLKPFIKELLDEFKNRNIKIALASATKKESIEAVIKRHGIDSYFSYVISVGEVGKDKFNPDIYLRCSTYFNLDPSKCLVFEDVYHAIETAKKANFKTVGVFDEHSSIYFDKIKEIATLIVLDPMMSY